MGPKFFLVGILGLKSFSRGYFRGSKIFSRGYFRGSKIFSRGYFVGPNFFFVDVSYIPRGKRGIRNNAVPLPQ